jgi:predicted RNA-binding protein YlqC (UPF0109 family)
MKALIEFLARSLVENPQAVRVEERTGEAGTVLELTVAPEDLGRMIGKEGRTIKAVRHLLTVAATKAKTKVSLVVQE